MMALNEHLTDAEITSAIRYLDPDSDAERTREDDGTAIGICIALLAELAGVLTYISDYMRKL